MSENSTRGRNGGGVGPDFQLPDEILSLIPTDPYEQLDLARKITSMAIASRVSNLESEVGVMSDKLYEKNKVISELEEKASRLEHACQEAEWRLKIAVEDNAKLMKERDIMAMTAKKLSRDLAKLESFKRQLMQSLNDECSSPAETVGIGTCDQSVPKAYAEKDGEANSYSSHSSFNGSTDMGNTDGEVSCYAGRQFSLTPYTPQLTPTGTPRLISTSGSPRRYSTVGSPNISSGATTPTKSQYEGRISLSSWYPSSQQSSAANSPPRNRPPAYTPRIDGKEFFRQARSRLSYEQFREFLVNIKELNAQKQSREETLRKAEEIFGVDNKDLYISFQGLLNRSIH